MDNDNINEEDTNEVQNEKTSETEVESEIKEDETTSKPKNAKKTVVAPRKTPVVPYGVKG